MEIVKGGSVRNPTDRSKKTARPFIGKDLPDIIILANQWVAVLEKVGVVFSLLITHPTNSSRYAYYLRSDRIIDCRTILP